MTYHNISKEVNNDLTQNEQLAGTLPDSMKVSTTEFTNSNHCKQQNITANAFQFNMPDQQNEQPKTRGILTK